LEVFFADKGDNLRKRAEKGGTKGGNDEDYFDCQPKRGMWQDNVRD
jgi:hypothetical protein